MRRAAVALLTLMLAPSAHASDYCQPSALPLLNPIDVPRGGSGSAATNAIRERSITVGGRRTRLLESGAVGGREAVVLVHGIPGSAADWADLLPLVGDKDTRAVALDLPGFGHAGPAWGLGRSPAVAAAYLDRVLKALRIKRVHLIAHDIGGPVALEWAIHRPKRLASATLINTGLLLGYKDHPIALASKPPGVGEAFWIGLNRPAFRAGLTANQPRPVPGTDLDRWYDDLDRETRCAILETYRSGTESEVDARARAQAAVLARNRTRPALVIWGAKDAFLPVAMAQRQRDGFPAARIAIFEQSGHWPFLDDRQRTAATVVPFIDSVTP